MLRAIFFDLGSTLWDDYPTELYQWELLTRLLAPHGISIDLPGLVALSQRVIASYSPSLTRAMAFQLLGGDREKYAQVMQELVRHMLAVFEDPAEFRRLNPLFDGVPELLTGLKQRFRLAVVSQNFAQAECWLAFHGIDGYFEHLTLSGKDGLYKPDPRLYELTCRALRVDPHEVVMVGDRLDNDIWPANRLRMTSVRVLADPYRCQQPRYHMDVPDYTVERVTDLPTLPCLRP